MKKKTLTTILLSSALGLFVLWFVFLSLRYAVFQKSANLIDNFKGIIFSFTNLDYTLPLQQMIWKYMAWLVLYVMLIFTISMIVDTIRNNKRHIGLLSSFSLLLSSIVVLDFISNSGNYFYYLDRFFNKTPNTFFAFGILGFLGLGVLVLSLSIVSYILVSKLEIEVEQNYVTDEKGTKIYKKKFDFKKFFANTYVYFMLFLMYAPILLLIVNSFNDSLQIGRWTTTSFNSYIKLFDVETYPQSAKIWSAVMNTAIVAVVSALLSTILGTVGAIGMFYSKKKIRTLLDFITQIPVVNAEIVMALSICMLFVFFKLPFSFFTLIIGHMVLGLPFVVLSVQPKLAQMDPNLYEAAMDLGATPTQALFKVILPEIMPGVISGFMLAITLSLDDYVITAFTMPNDGEFNTISTYVEQITKKSNLPVQLRAFTTLLFVIILVVMIIYTIRVNKKERAK